MVQLVDVTMLALACPRCSTTDAVRAAVFGDGFWTTLAALLLPLLLITVVAAALYSLGRNPTENKP